MNGVARIVAKIISAVSILIIVLVILVGSSVVVPRFFGYQVYNVVSGSMEPEIPVNSVVFVKYTDPEELVPGDIIAFSSDMTGALASDVVVTHRVVENNMTEGEFITKGDANSDVDISPVKYSDLIGEVKLHVPVLGGVAAGLGTTNGRIWAVCILVSALLLQTAAGIITKQGTGRHNGSKEAGNK